MRKSFLLTNEKLSFAQGKLALEASFSACLAKKFKIILHKKKQSQFFFSIFKDKCRLSISLTFYPFVLFFHPTTLKKAKQPAVLVMLKLTKMLLSSKRKSLKIFSAQICFFSAVWFFNSFEFRLIVPTFVTKVTECFCSVCFFFRQILTF